MGLFDFLSGKKGVDPAEARIRRLVKKLTQKFGESYYRMDAAHQLLEMKTEESLFNLLQRYDVVIESTTVDIDEKEELADRIASLGEPAVRPILRHLVEKDEISYPMRILERIVEPSRFTSFLLEALEKIGPGYGRRPEKKVQILETLKEQDDPGIIEKVLPFLEDPDDDVRIAIIDFIQHKNREDFREKLLEMYIETDDRPRVRTRILELLEKKKWTVKGFRKKMEENLLPNYYITGKGTIQHSSMER